MVYNTQLLCVTYNGHVAKHWIIWHVSQLYTHRCVTQTGEVKRHWIDLWSKYDKIAAFPEHCSTRFVGWCVHCCIVEYARYKFIFFPHKWYYTKQLTPILFYLNVANMFNIIFIIVYFIISAASCFLLKINMPKYYICDICWALDYAQCLLGVHRCWSAYSMWRSSEAVLVFLAEMKVLLTL